MGRVGIWPPVILLKAQLQLCSNLSKNSNKSGSSFGDGANFNPNSKASFWLGVRTCDDRLRIEEWGVVLFETPDGVDSSDLSEELTGWGVGIGGGRGGGGGGGIGDGWGEFLGGQWSTFWKI